MGTLKRAAEFSVGSTLILGRPQSGRTTVAINRLAGKKVLWLSCNNLGVVADTDKLADGSVLHVITEWPQFKAIIDSTKKGEYDFIVVDGLNNAKDFWFNHNFANKSPTQSDWADMGKDLSKVVLDLRGIAPIYAIIDIEKAVDDKTKNVYFDMALNLDAQRRITGLFDVKLQTIAVTAPKMNLVTKTLEQITTYSFVSGADALIFNR